MRNRSITFIKWCVVLLLFGKGILHFTADQPYHFLFGESVWIAPFFGSVLLVFGFLAMLPNILLKKGDWIYAFAVPSLLLIVESAASYIKAGSVIEQFIEHSLQMALPLLLIFVVKTGRLSARKFYYFITVFVALTFIGHATFALGAHYIPGNFIEMTSKSLWISNDAAVDFLFVIRWLDIICALLAFVPFVRKYVIWYLIVWGFLTALARTYFVLNGGLTPELLAVNLPNTIYRIPHGAIPVLMLILAWKLDVQTRKKMVLITSKV